MPLPFDLSSLGSAATQVAIAALSKGWTVLDPKGRSLAQAIADAIARAAAKAWTQSSSIRAGLPSNLSDGEADLRALFLSTVIARTNLLDAARKPSPDDQVWADVLTQSWVILAKDAGYKGESKDDIEKQTPKAMAELIEVVAVIVGALLIAAIGAFVIYKASELIQIALADKVENDEMMRLHAEAQTILDNHFAMERAAGHPLPYTADEMKLLEQLHIAQQHIAEIVAPPKPQPPPGSAGIDVAIVVLALGVVGGGYLILRPKRG
jgi:hypothetical protein